MEQKFLECGKIVNTHGVKGAVKIESWCDSPDVLADLERVFFREGDRYREASVKKASVFKQFVLMEIEGIESLDDAMLYKNRTLYAARDDFDLEEGDYFIADLIGLSVIDEKEGTVYGVLKSVVNHGASDIYVIDTPAGERMMPAVEEFVKRIDFENGIYISPIEGMLD